MLYNVGSYSVYIDSWKMLLLLLLGTRVIGNVGLLLVKNLVVKESISQRLGFVLHWILLLFNCSTVCSLLI